MKITLYSSVLIPPIFRGVDQGIIELLKWFERHGTAAKPIIGIGECRELFDGFEARWAQYRESRAAEAPGLNIWDVANLGRDEVRNCRVLSWLLDPQGSHFQGSRFLNCFLAAAGEAPLAPGEEEAVRVRPEVWVGEDSRVDLRIETDQRCIWVEAKIQAAECFSQIGRYSALAEIGLGRRRFAGRLLTVGGSSGESVGHGFRRMVWKDVAIALRQFSSGAANPFVARLADQYGDYLRNICDERS